MASRLRLPCRRQRGVRVAQCLLRKSPYLARSLTVRWVQAQHGATSKAQNHERERVGGITESLDVRAAADLIQYRGPARRPAQNSESGSFKGTADAVYQNLHLIERERPDLVAVFAADHVYRMDVRQMARFHRERGAEVSIAAVPVPMEKASAFGIMATGSAGELRDFQEKPERPAPTGATPGRAYASMGNYLFNPGVLRELLEQANRRGDTDFGHHILPRLPHSQRAFAYDFASNQIPGVRPVRRARLLARYRHDRSVSRRAAGRAGALAALQSCQSQVADPRRCSPRAEAHGAAGRAGSGRNIAYGDGRERADCRMSPPSRIGYA